MSLFASDEPYVCVTCDAADLGDVCITAAGAGQYRLQVLLCPFCYIPLFKCARLGSREGKTN